ncbi:hypothetical protein [Arthrobacter rhombi]|uniref:hypothetical protein n=1 Tax=Arthrobacter rhombi TaxID=71253 RepID=UPI0031E46086
MQINPRMISRLVRLGTKAFRSYQSSQKRDQGPSQGGQPPAGPTGSGQGSPGQKPSGDGSGG